MILDIEGHSLKPILTTKNQFTTQVSVERK